MRKQCIPFKIECSPQVLGASDESESRKSHALVKQFLHEPPLSHYPVYTCAFFILFIFVLVFADRSGFAAALYLFRYVIAAVILLIPVIGMLFCKTAKQHLGLLGYIISDVFLLAVFLTTFSAA